VKNKLKINYTVANPDPLLTEILIMILKQKQGEKSWQKLCRIQQNLAKPWQFEKQSYSTFTPGLNRW
jgi:hypothetical protein